MSTIKATNFQHASAANPAIVLAADGSATANITSINNGPLAGMRNAIINGNFDIWQRGTSFTSGDYGADRWFHYRFGTTHTVTREAFTLGQTNVPGEPTYYCRTVVSSVAGAGNAARLIQRLENVRTFAGQQITVSFWAKVDATKNIAVEFQQFFGSGGSPSATASGIGVTKVSIGTSWQKVTVTSTILSISGKTLGSDGSDSFRLNIWFDAGSDFNSRTDSLGQQSGTFDIAQVQVEPGPVATPFERRPIGTELGLCQRYFLNLGGGAHPEFNAGSLGIKYASASGEWPVGNYCFPVTMRSSPTVTGTFTSLTNATSITTQTTVRAARIYAAVITAGAYIVDLGEFTFSSEL